MRTTSSIPAAASTSAQDRYASWASRTASGRWYDSRMMREWSSEAPWRCPSSNRSKPITPSPSRREAHQAAALPSAPEPDHAHPEPAHPVSVSSWPCHSYADIARPVVERHGRSSTGCLPSTLAIARTCPAAVPQHEPM